MGLRLSISNPPALFGGLKVMIPLGLFSVAFLMVKSRNFLPILAESLARLPSLFCYFAEMCFGGQQGENKPHHPKA